MALSKSHICRSFESPTKSILPSLSLSFSHPSSRCRSFLTFRRSLVLRKQFFRCPKSLPFPIYFRVVVSFGKLNSSVLSSKTKCTRRTSEENTTLTAETWPGFTGALRSGTSTESFTGKEIFPLSKVHADTKSGGSTVGVTGKDRRWSGGDQVHRCLRGVQKGTSYFHGVNVRGIYIPLSDTIFFSFRTIYI